MRFIKHLEGQIGEHLIKHPVETDVVSAGRKEGSLLYIYLLTSQLLS